ncbi:MAG TPA: sigma 54-interacting transcriptional regulator [Polyangiales bacterium]|nr:sigma 54-interacting transcriptional regulator [Polyangiales bacterium]
MAERARARVLVIDDGVAYARVVREQLPELELLAPPGSEEGRFADGPSALEFLGKQRKRVDLVLLDVSFDLPEARLLPLSAAGAKPASSRETRRYQGVAILRAIRARWPDLPVVLLTGQRDMSLVDVDGELASQSMTYFLDGEDLDALRIGIHAALLAAREELSEGDVLWGRDPQLAALRRRLRVLARGSLPVILEGETGTGKSYLAERFVHRHSERGGPFVAFDLSTLPGDLVAAQLFGAQRGAYTGAVSDRKGLFELANGGTLFLDELQNIPLDVQKQLLMVLQERKVRPLGAAREVAVDVKLVAASNASLAKAVAEQRFRADLYMRLSPATRVSIPPLRERLGDLRWFSERFAERATSDPDLGRLRERLALALGLPKDAPLVLRVESASPGPAAQSRTAIELVLPRSAWQQLERHGWPGNLRELSMLIHNLLAFTLVRAADALDSGVGLRSARLQIDPGLVGELLAASAAPSGNGASGGGLLDQRVQLMPADSLNAVARAAERQYLSALFAGTRGDFEEMAELLLGDRKRSRALRLRFNQLGISIRELRRP